MAFTTFFIDLDDTMYSSSSGLWQLMRQRIDLYVAEKFGLALEEARVLRHDLWQQFGTTMRGLQAMYQIDEEEYLSYVHNVPLHQYIGPDPQLRQMLLSYPQRKYIFTNADHAHASRVLDVLAVSDCFTGIIDIHQISPYCKPMPEAYQIALQQVAELPEHCVVVDDYIPNLDTAQQVGMQPILVGERQAAPCAYPHISHLLDLPSVIPPEA